MPEAEIAETPQPSESKPTNWPKMVLALVLGLTLLATATYAGYWYGTQQTRQIEKPAVVSQPTSKPTATPEPTSPSVTDPTVNWKTYKSNKVGYSIKAPPNWEVIPNEDDSLLSHQDYVTNMTLVPEGEGQGMRGNSVEIAFPISIQGPHKHIGGKLFEGGLDGLALPSEPSTWFTKQESSYTQVDSRRALVKIVVYKSVPPSGFVGGWCNCTHKNVYIDLGNGKILHILGQWENDNPQFETTFDQILSTFKFLD